MVLLNQGVTKNDFNDISSFSTNVPLTDKPGSWFLLAKCLKNIFNFKNFFKHFASKNQVPGPSVSETLVENGLNCLGIQNFKKVSFVKNKL